MIIRCPDCQKLYRIKEELPPHKSFRFMCRHCGHMVMIDNSRKKPVINGKQERAENYKNNDTKKQTIEDDSVQFEETIPNSKIFYIRATLRVKLNLALSAIFCIAIVTIFFMAGERMERSSLKQVFAKSRLLLTTMESSRHFTSRVIKPSLYDVIPFKYIVEGMSSVSGQQSIFDEFRVLYPKYFFKLAVPMPRNPVNTPNEFEMSIIEKFQNNSELKQWSGYTRINGKNHFVIMEPIVADSSCLRCHSNPETAPDELNRRYATLYGFGLKKTGDIYGALTVSVPETVITAEAKSNTLVFIVMVSAFFAVLLLILNLLFGRVVLRPIKRLAKNANAISIGNQDTHVEISGVDEISQLARSFERMRNSVKLAFNKLKRYRRVDPDQGEVL